MCSDILCLNLCGSVDKQVDHMHSINIYSGKCELSEVLPLLSYKQMVDDMLEHLAIGIRKPLTSMTTSTKKS